jgi:hypothetical protein
MKQRLIFAVGALGLCFCSAATSAPPNSNDVYLRDAAIDAAIKDTGAKAVDVKQPVQDTSPPVEEPENDASSETRCTRPSDQDNDGDGFSTNQGDCDDCKVRVNPGAFDFPDNDLDEDCSGTAATSIEECDQNLKLDSSDAKDAARAIGLCKFTDKSSKSWGVISARYTESSGTGKLTDPRAVGIVPDFGAAKPKAGASMLALSSGVARAAKQTGYTSDCDTFDAICPITSLTCTSGGATPPAGYPKESSVCKDQWGSVYQETKIFNQAAFEVQIRVPNNANSFSFDSIFYTYEYPNYICSEYNDFFVVFKEPKPPKVADGNIVFDKNGDPIGVNTGLLAVCDPKVQLAEAAKHFDCEQGTALLQGTGYGQGETTCFQAGGASTGWLQTQAPVEPGEVITLRFAVWDTNDPILDSTALIDHFAWGESDEPPPEVETVPLI